MAIGKVKWFNNAKGYGFILRDSGGEDLFAHFSSIQMEGYRTLKAGQEVEFEVVEGAKGLHAVEIKPLEQVESENSIAESQQDDQIPESSPAYATEEASFEAVSESID